MAHGAGGKATQSMIEGLFVPAFGGERSTAMDDAGAVEVDGVELAMTTDSFVVKPIRFPGGSIGDLAVNGTVNDLAVAGRAPARAEPVADPRGGPRRRRAAGRGRGDRRAPPSAAGVRDRRRRHQGRRARRTPTRCTSAPTGVGPARPARAPGRRRDPPGRPHPAVRARSASTARRSCWRAASSSSTPTIESDTRSLWPVGRRAAGGGRAVAALHARRDPRRRGLGAERAGARVAAWRCSCARRRCRSTPRSPGASEILGIDPMYVANEGKLVAFVAPEAADGRSPRCARSPAASARRRSARCAPSRPGWCWWRRALAASG